MLQALQGPKDKDQTTVDYLGKGQKMALIYKYTNVTDNAGYVGATTKPVGKRWKQHISDAMHNRYNSVFHAAIRKYGPENFTCEILYEHPDRDHVFKEMEPHFIREHNTLVKNGHGYNLTEGGDGMVGYICSEETREKMREQN